MAVFKVGKPLSGGKILRKGGKKYRAYKNSRKIGIASTSLSKRIVIRAWV